MLSADSYARQLKQLLPMGAAWNLDAGSRLSALLRGLAEEFARVDGRAAALIEEADARTTFELLTDWERVLGLPDPCVIGEQSFAQRRAAVVARLVGLGGQTPAYFIGVAAALGYTITVTEFSPHDVDDDVEAPLYGDDWAYAWQVNAPLNTVRELTVNDPVSDGLAIWGNEALECVLNRLAPAHTLLVFEFA